MTKEALGYVRVSTEEQARFGVSIDAQEERIRAYCQMAGLTLIQIVREEGVSGSVTLGDRPAGMNLVRMLSKKQARHVVALKLDRLFRDAEDALRQTRTWDKGGVTLHLVDMGGQAFCSASAMGRMFLTMMAAFAELERNLISERTVAAMSHKKARGDAYARTPYGFERSGEQFIRNEVELVIVQQIRAWRLAGRTLTEIAAELNAGRVPTKRGGHWYASTVKYLCENSLYKAA